VSNHEVWPDTGKFMLVQPFSLEDIYQETLFGPVKNEVAGRRITFFRYHHVEMIDDDQEGHKFPQIVAQKIDYQAVPVDPFDATKGMDLLRNGKKINYKPLYQVIFQRVPPIVAEEQVQGSPNAFIDVTVVPMGEKMNVVIYETMKEQGAVLRRMFHLIGYESQYTTILNLALERLQSNALGKSPKTEDDLLDGYMLAVYRDAQEYAPQNLLKNITERIEKGNTLGFKMPEKTIRIDPALFDDTTGNQDPFFANARKDFKEVDPTSVDDEADGLAVGTGGFTSDIF